MIAIIIVSVIALITIPFLLKFIFKNPDWDENSFVLIVVVVLWVALISAPFTLMVAYDQYVTDRDIRNDLKKLGYQVEDIDIDTHTVVVRVENKRFECKVKHLEHTGWTPVSKKECKLVTEKPVTPKDLVE